MPIDMPEENLLQRRSDDIIRKSNDTLDQLPHQMTSTLNQMTPPAQRLEQLLLDIFLLQGPRGGLFRLSDVPLYRCQTQQACQPSSTLLLK